MIWFFLCVGLLVAGYFLYGKFIERIFGPKPEAENPAITMADGSDYVPMSDKKVYLVQLLNIAGVGPIFGPIPAFLPSTASRHALDRLRLRNLRRRQCDYFSGMLSVRVPGRLGADRGRRAPRQRRQALHEPVCRGAAHAGGRGLCAGARRACSPTSPPPIWSTGCGHLRLPHPGHHSPHRPDHRSLLPIFGALLVFACRSGLIIGLMVSGRASYNTGWTSPACTRPELPLWPLLFITIACGAVSRLPPPSRPLMALHAEQSSAASSSTAP